MADVIEDPAFPDRIGIAGGPLTPCRVTEFSITTAPTATVREYYDGGVSVRDQAAQHVIRYEVPHGAPHPGPTPERIEASWMTGSGEVRIAAIDLIADPRPGRPAGQRLDAAIRARLDVIESCMDGYTDMDGAQEMHAALTVVLDLHKPMEGWHADHETPAPLPFGLMLRRPGDIADPDAAWPDPREHEGIYLAPDFTTRHLRHDTGAVSDPRYGDDGAQQWSLSLPHRCGEWGIWDGTREDVLEAARRFRTELDQAITAMENAGD